MGNTISKIITGLFLILLCSCGSDTDKTTQNSSIQKQKKITNKPSFSVQLEKPSQGQNFICEDTISVIALINTKEELQYDSASLFVNGKKEHTLNTKPYSFKWESKNRFVGEHNLRVTVYSGGFQQSASVSIRLLSDIEPTFLDYKVVKSYPHDKEAYTQGLIYEGGILYEGTGQYGESSLRKVKLETGELIQSYSLPKDVFGEGIVTTEDKIIQITWRSQQAFSFEKESFKLLNKFTFQTQGWGITNFNYKGSNEFIMSDGTNHLYIIDDELFTEISRFEVWDNKGPIQSLNELENINGMIFANVWQSSMIAVINPQNGKMISVIDLSRLVPTEYYGDQDNVLNGIAYNPENNHLYITGKRWPKLYEIELI